MRDLALAGILVPLLAMAVVRPFVGVLVWFWIAFMSPHREVYGFAFSQPWAVLAFFATVFGCFVAREPKKLTLNAVVVGLLLFAVVITVSSAVAFPAAAADSRRARAPGTSFSTPRPQNMSTPARNCSASGCVTARRAAYRRSSSATTSWSPGGGGGAGCASRRSSKRT